VLACALAGEAEYIVSGDPHLLDLREYQGIRILSPAAFASFLDAQQ
jgi:predicted nucleic acid-binding protein